MPRNSSHESTYLPPEYQEVLTPVRANLEAIEFPPEDIPVREVIRDQLGRVLSAQHSFQKFTTKESKSRRPDKIKTHEDFDSYLRLGALKVVGKDLMYRQIIQTISAAASEAVKDGNREASERARDTAETIIDHRAINNTFSLLDAHNLTYGAYGEETESVWDRSIAAHERHPRAKPPAYISEREGGEFWAILQRQREANIKPSKPLIKPSRSKLLMGMRLAKLMRETGPISRDTDPILDQINSLGEIVTNALVLQTMFEITPKEIIRSMQTAAKARRYMDSAAHLDASVSGDPTYQLVSYLGAEVGGYDTRAELAVFDRDVRRKAKNNK